MSALFLRQLIAAASSPKVGPGQPVNGEGEAGPSSSGEPSTHAADSSDGVSPPSLPVPSSTPPTRPQLNWSRCRVVASRIGRGLHSAGSGSSVGGNGSGDSGLVSIGSGAGGGTPTALMLQCEHWLEAADPNHRYGSNLRPYWEYWLSELQARERGYVQAEAQLRQRQQAQHESAPGPTAAAAAADLEREVMEHFAAVPSGDDCREAEEGHHRSSHSVGSAGSSSGRAALGIAAAASGGRGSEGQRPPNPLAHWPAGTVQPTRLLHPTADDEQLANSGRHLMRRSLASMTGTAPVLQPSSEAPTGSVAATAGAAAAAGPQAQTGGGRISDTGGALLATAPGCGSASSFSVRGSNLVSADAADVGSSGLPVPRGMRRSHSAPRLKELASSAPAAAAAGPLSPLLATAPALCSPVAAGAAPPPPGPVSAAAVSAALVEAPLPFLHSQPPDFQHPLQSPPPRSPPPRSPPPPQQQQQHPPPRPRRADADARFFFWLDEGVGRHVDLSDKGVPRSKLERERVQYLTEAELERLEVRVERGLLVYVATGQPVDTGSELRLVPAEGGVASAAAAAAGGGGPGSGGGTQAHSGTAEAAAAAGGGSGGGAEAPAGHVAAEDPASPHASAAATAAAATAAAVAAAPPRPRRPGKYGGRIGGFELPALFLLRKHAAAGKGEVVVSQDEEDASPQHPQQQSSQQQQPQQQHQAVEGAKRPAPAKAGGAGGASADSAEEGLLRYEAKPCKWIYVLDTAGRLYVHAKRRGSFHHSSFLRGGAVLSAGGIVVASGRIVRLTADSGHYKPDFHNFMGMVGLLRDWGADLSETRLSAKHIECPL